MPTTLHRKPLVRRLAAWLGLCAAATLLSGCAFFPPSPNGDPVPSNGSTDPARPFNGTRPAKVVKQDIYDTIDDIVKHSGATFPSWNRTNPPGLLTEYCVFDGYKGTQYAVHLDGGPVKDSDQAITTMKTHWEALHYNIGNYFPDMGANTTGRQLNATSPAGAQVQFTPAEDGSSISVKSECTLDPTARDRPSPPSTPEPQSP